jgi:hypothetical protein
MGMFTIGRRVRVDNHHAIDIVDMGKHRYACLICQEQSQQHQGNEYVSTLQHSFYQIGCKISLFMLIVQICAEKYLYLTNLIKYRKHEKTFTDIIGRYVLPRGKCTEQVQSFRSEINRQLWYRLFFGQSFWWKR